MWLTILTPDEMLAVTANWIDPSAQRDVFLSIPEIAPLMPHVEDAHAALLAAATANTGAGTADVPAIEAKEETIDKRYGHATRAMLHLGAAYHEYLLATDPPDLDAAQHATVMLAELFPLKGKTVSLNYQAEAGAAQVACTFLSGATDHQQLLSTMAIADKVSGLDVAHLWFDLGAELGSLEAQKTQHVASGVKAVNMNAVRNGWTSVVRTVMDNLRHTKAPASAVEQITAPVNSATSKATQRINERRRHKAPAKPAAAPAPGQKPSA